MEKLFTNMAYNHLFKKSIIMIAQKAEQANSSLKKTAIGHYYSEKISKKNECILFVVISY